MIIMQTDHPFLTRRSDLVSIDEEKTCNLADFTVPGEYRVKINVSEKIDKYLHLAREQKKKKRQQKTKHQQQ